MWTPAEKCRHAALISVSSFFFWCNLSSLLEHLVFWYAFKKHISLIYELLNSKRAQAKKPIHPELGDWNLSLWFTKATKRRQTLSMWEALPAQCLNSEWRQDKNTARWRLHCLNNTGDLEKQNWGNPMDSHTFFHFFAHATSRHFAAGTLNVIKWHSGNSTYFFYLIIYYQ